MTAMHEITDNAAARLFWELGRIMREFDQVPRHEQATYASIVAIRLAAWLIGHGDNTEAEIDALIRLHQDNLAREARRPLVGEDGERLQALAATWRRDHAFPKPQGTA